MRRFFPSTAVFMLMVLAGEPIAIGADPMPTLKDGDRIVFIGDSITQNGQYPNLLECYLLEKHPTLKLTFRNAAWNSDRAWLHMRTADQQSLSGDAMLKMTAGDEQEKMRSAICAHGLARDILPLKPTVATIMFGANDVRDGENALELHLRSMRQMIRTLREANCRVFVLSPSPEQPGSQFNAVHEAWIPAVKRLTHQEQAAYIDVFHPVLEAVAQAQHSDTSFAYTTDGVHPREQGHVMIAEAILEGMGVTDAQIDPTSPLVAKVAEKNKTHFHRWREVQVPALVAGKVDTDEVRAVLAADDERIAELETQIDVLRRPND